ncbi:MAG: hypothetical protein CMO78_07210 [Verrucomicrobiales bacterium]|nr:hypothetical protein [Verrucomicrobiales bacterium]
MWYAGQRVKCTNDSFSGAIWEWTDSVPRAGQVYTIAAMDYLPQWNTRTPVLSFLLQELRDGGDQAYYSAWRFEPATRTPLWETREMNPTHHPRRVPASH